MLLIILGVILLIVSAVVLKNNPALVKFKPIGRIVGFIFILLGGPFIETTHGNLKFTAPLSAITAAVVGVIVNLALFFAYHVFWPLGFSNQALSNPVDWFSIALTLLATVAIFKYKTNVIVVILASGLLGMAWRLIHLAY